MRIIGNRKTTTEIDRTLVDRLNDEAKRAPAETVPEAGATEPARDRKQEGRIESIHLEPRLARNGKEENYFFWKSFYETSWSTERPVRMASLADLYETIERLNILRKSGDPIIEERCDEYRNKLLVNLWNGMLFDTKICYRTNTNTTIIHNPKSEYQKAYDMTLPGYDANIHDILRTAGGQKNLNQLFLRANWEKMMVGDLDYFLKGRELRLESRPTRKKYRLFGEEVREPGEAIAKIFSREIVEDSNGIRSTRDVLVLSLDTPLKEKTENGYRIPEGVTRAYEP